MLNLTNVSKTYPKSSAKAVDSLNLDVKDGEILNLAGFEIRVLHTPGHTQGGVCYYIEEEKALFSGDTLFCQSVGRTDFPTGKSSTLIHSIQDKLMPLPDDTMVYTGHEDMTTIGMERRCTRGIWTRQRLDMKRNTIRFYRERNGEKI